MISPVRKTLRPETAGAPGRRNRPRGRRRSRSRTRARDGRSTAGLVAEVVRADVIDNGAVVRGGELAATASFMSGFAEYQRLGRPTYWPDRRPAREASSAQLRDRGRDSDASSSTGTLHRGSPDADARIARRSLRHACLDRRRVRRPPQRMTHIHELPDATR